MKNGSRLGLMLAATLAFSAPARSEEGKIKVENAWVRAVPPSSGVTAAYMTLKNESSGAMYLESVATAAAASAEIHRMSRSQGMMTMEQVDGVPVPPHGRAALEPNGYHLMLIGLKKPLRPGDTVKLRLRFRGKYRLTVLATVKEELGGEKAAKP